MERKYMEKECELYGVSNKVGKFEHLMGMKEKKIEQLQKMLVVHNEEGENLQNLEKVDRSLILEMNADQNNNVSTVQKLKEELNRTEEQLELGKNEIFSLVKQKQQFSVKIRDLEDTVRQQQGDNQELIVENENLQSMVRQLSSNLQGKNDVDSESMNIDDGD